ncbi:MAG: peptidase domain-containing ABC transporter [Pseudohongiellaceae bacterium]
MKWMSWYLPRRKLPLVLQSETTECGLACIAMVAGYFGNRVDLCGLRQRFTVSGRGAAVNHLMQVARDMALTPRALKLEPGEIDSLQLPAVLHWDMDHFVVLRSVGRRHVILHDPASGRRKYRREEVLRHFTGIALELMPSREFVARDERRRHRLQDLFSITPRFVSSMLQVFVLSMMLQLLALLTPFYIQLTIDQGLARRDTDLVLVVALAFLMIVLAKTALTWLRGMVLLHFSNHLGFQMVNNVFHHLIRLPVNYFERRHMGDIVSRFGSLQSIRQLVSQEMISVVVDGLFSLVTLVLLYLYSPMLATLVLSFIAVYLIVRGVTLPAEYQRRQEQIAAEASQQSVFMENVRAISVTRLYGMENHRIGLWQTNYAELIDRGVQLGRLQLNVETTQTLLFGLDHVATIYFGTRFVYAGELSIGQLMAFIFLKQHFISSITEMIPRLVELRLLRLQLERVSDITLERPVLRSLDEPFLVPPIQGELRADQLTCRYPGAEEPVFRDLELRVGSGECLALTGPSGCGKTTLLKALAGLVEPESGVIRIDGQALEDFGVRRYRQRLAAVLHDDTLLAGSLRDNIVLDATPQPDDSDVWRCLERTGIAQEVRHLVMGLDTRVGDMGAALSAGQVQRILLARALYRDPLILLLDEAFANLGSEQAISILQRLRESVNTIVLVTHNPALVAACDREVSLS